VPPGTAAIYTEIESSVPADGIEYVPAPSVPPDHHGNDVLPTLVYPTLNELLLNWQAKTPLNWVYPLAHWACAATVALITATKATRKARIRIDPDVGEDSHETIVKIPLDFAGHMPYIDDCRWRNRDDPVS
jgi:hypothetical protein